MSKPNAIACPQCSSQELWKFGRDPKSGIQKYRCKKCHSQFLEGQTHRRKPCKDYSYPQPICPRCGARMGVFKHLPDATRFRCLNYNKKGSAKCSQKLNMPLGDKPHFKLITNIEDIELISGKINPVFHWNKMKFPPMTIAIAMYFAICEGNAATEISKIMHNIYNIKISHDTITRWHHKAGFLLSAKTRHLAQIPQKPGRKPRLFADETQLGGAKEKRWFWMSYCRKYDLMLGRNLTPHRDTSAARDLIAMTQKLAPTLKTSELLTDGLWSYPSAMGDLNIQDDKHIRYVSFFSKPNNNALERKWSNFKNKARVYRGIKSDVGKMAFIEGQIFYHNCLKPSEHLNGKTPYKNLNAKLPKFNSEIQLLFKLLTK